MPQPGCSMDHLQAAPINYQIALGPPITLKGLFVDGRDREAGL